MKGEREEDERMEGIEVERARIREIMSGLSFFPSTFATSQLVNHLTHPIHRPHYFPHYY